MKIISNKNIIVIFTITILFIINYLILYIYPSRPDKWYEELKKPNLNPPNIIFPIVWTILYILIIISYYYGLNKIKYEYWIIPIIHLLLNFSYSPVFFNYKQLLLSSIITLLTLVFAIITLIIFNLRITYILMFPYIIWLLFANYLSWSIFIINKNNKKIEI